MPSTKLTSITGDLQYLMNFTDPSNNRLLDSSGGTYGDTSAVLLEYSFPLTLT